MSVEEMCKPPRSSYSDNTCANLLLARIGGPPALTAFLALDWRPAFQPPGSQRTHVEPLAAGRSA
jgi:hypothetical protein